MKSQAFDFEISAFRCHFESQSSVWIIRPSSRLRIRLVEIPRELKLEKHDKPLKGIEIKSIDNKII